VAANTCTTFHESTPHSQRTSQHDAPGVGRRHLGSCWRLRDARVRAPPPRDDRVCTTTRSRAATGTLRATLHVLRCARLLKSGVESITCQWCGPGRTVRTSRGAGQLGGGASSHSTHCRSGVAFRPAPRKCGPREWWSPFCRLALKYSVAAVCTLPQQRRST